MSLLNWQTIAQPLVSLAAVLVTGLVYADCPTNLSLVNPDRDFAITEGLDPAAPTVTHLPTGLVWLSCSLGQRWQSGACVTADAEAEYTWEEALQAADQASYQGYTDWRLPNKKELASLIEFGCSAPAINANVFAGTATAAYWTSTPLPAGFSPASAWTVDFDSGSFTSLPRDSRLHVRLVRGGQ